MKEYKWKPVTVKELRQLMARLKQLFHLRDWKLHLDTKTMPCPTMKLYLAEQGYDDENKPFYRTSGTSYCLPDRQEAYIWIPLALARDGEDGGEDASEILLHEMLHIFSAAYKEEEIRVMILSETLFPLLGEIACGQ